MENRDGSQKERYFEPEESSYYQMFLNGYTYRKSCYFCPFASEYRQGDITIGDYWGIELVHPEYLKKYGGEIEKEKGVSCLIVNNEQGRTMLAKYGSNIIKYPSSYQRAAKYNAQLVQAVCTETAAGESNETAKTELCMCGTVVSETKKQNSVCEKTSFHDTEKNQNIYKKNQSLRLERKRWNNNLKQLLRQIQNGSIFLKETYEYRDPDFFVCEKRFYFEI